MHNENIKMFDYISIKDGTTHKENVVTPCFQPNASNEPIFKDRISLVLNKLAIRRSPNWCLAADSSKG